MVGLGLYWLNKNILCVMDDLLGTVSYKIKIGIDLFLFHRTRRLSVSPFRIVPSRCTLIDVLRRCKYRNNSIFL